MDDQLPPEGAWDAQPSEEEMEDTAQTDDALPLVAQPQVSTPAPRKQRTDRPTEERYEGRRLQREGLVSKLTCKIQIGANAKLSTALPPPNKRVFRHVATPSASTDPPDAAAARSTADITEIEKEASIEVIMLLAGLCHRFKDENTTDVEDAIFEPQPENEPSALPQDVAPKPKADEDEEEAEGTVGTWAAYNGLDFTTPPLSNIHDIFDAIAANALDKDFDDACLPFKDEGIRIFTMCSGTESPVISMDLLQRSLRLRGADNFKHRHLGSAEIEPAKQAFIERNFKPPVIFRDVTEFISHGVHPNDDGLRPLTAYGAHADPPRGVHILVAGASCVDFSKLNAQPKKYGEKGESSQTFDGVFAYAKTYRPNLILMENVMSTPWAEMAAKWQEINYHSQVVKLDSINYYLPQTRARTYCLVIDMDHADQLGFDYEEAGDAWACLMAQFQRRASVPYSDFMLSESDPRLMLEKNKKGEAEPKLSPTDWDACRRRHAAIRALLKLGNGTPYTSQRGGFPYLLDDHAWQTWALTQSARVIDFLNISMLRYASTRDFDMRYKHRNINISQNADRDEDKRKWGVVGCVTPKGSLFETLRGGPLTGLEVFALQGMPIGDLSLSKESSKQLQDLAGNAMTTTVIGSAIISAIIACHRQTKSPMVKESIFEKYASECRSEATQSSLNKLSQPQLKSKLALIKESNLKPLENIRSDTDQHLDKIVEAAQTAQPVCHCEGLDRHVDCNTLICAECFDTCCASCQRQNHGSLGQFSLQTSDRGSAREFAQYLTDLLPPALKLSADAAEMAAHYEKNPLFTSAQNSIMAALASTVRFQGVSFDKSWRAKYESGSAKLELEFAPKRPRSDTSSLQPVETFQSTSLEATWFMFAKPDPQVSAGDDLRDLLRHPVAIMKPSGTPMSGSWQFWNGPQESCRLHVTGVGAQKPSWEKSLGLQMPPFPHLTVFEELEIDAPSASPEPEAAAFAQMFGKYKLLEDCPAACATLHKQSSGPAEGDAPLFLYLNPSPIQDAHHDSMVIATQPPSHSGADNRSILAKFTPGWRPVAGTDTRGKDLSGGIEVDCKVFNQWSSLKVGSLIEPEEAQLTNTWFQPNFSVKEGTVCADCFATILLVEVPLDTLQQNAWKPGHAFSIELEDKPEALKDFAWILATATEIGTLPRGQREVPVKSTIDCNKCSPSMPQLKWVHNNLKNGVVKPIEDARAAALYEHALKDRPNPASAILHCDGSHALLEITVNVKTLQHRAVALLGRNSSADFPSSSVDWKLVRYHHHLAAPRFGPLTLQPTDSAKVVNTLTVGTRNLWLPQRAILAWMRSQEKETADWREMALVESRLPSLGWRLEVEAFQKVEVRGGIVADEVGAGKTTTSLALVKMDYDDLKLGTINSHAATSGLFKTDATLILMPKNIIKQWATELDTCLAWRKQRPNVPVLGRPYYLEIANTQDLQRYPLTTLQSASLILAPFDIFEDETYWSNLQKLACAPNVPIHPGRAFDEWLEQALPGMTSVVEALQHSKAALWTKWEELKSTTAKYERFSGYKTRASNKVKNSARGKEANQKADEDEESRAPGDDELAPTAKTAVPSKRKAAPRKGAAAPRKATARKRSRDDREEPTDEDLAADTPELGRADEEDKFETELQAFRKAEKIPMLLHMFSFRRVIVDEFQYLRGKTLLALLHFDASARWLLSGTPPIHDYDSVNTMAKLLKTRISTHNEQEGKFGFGKDATKMTKDKSDAQEFQSYQGLASSDFKETIYQHAEEFCNTFIRKNQIAVKLPDSYHHEHMFDITPTEAFTYQIVDQLVTAQECKFNRKVRGGGSDEPDAAIHIPTELKKLIEQTAGPDAARVCSTSMLNRFITADADEIQEREEEMVRKALDTYERPAFTRLFDILRALRELCFISGNFSSTKTFDSFQRNLQRGDIQAKSLATALQRLLLYATKNPSEPHTPVSGKDSGQPGAEKPELKLTSMGARDRAKEIDTRVANVGKLIESLSAELGHIRLLRFVLGVMAISNLKSCSRCGDVPTDLGCVTVSTTCGHIVGCDHCFREGEEKTLFDTRCCHLFVPEFALPGTAFGMLVDATLDDKIQSLKTSRMRKAISIIRSFIETPESGVVFVQHEMLKNDLVEACKAVDVSCFDGWSYTTRQVARFTQAAKGGKQGSILILQLDSADAAGWNLQCANHVIFLAPLLAGSSEAEHAATMTQAIGRCLRPHQTKGVHVYHLGARTTVEEGMVRQYLGKISKK